MAWIVLIASGIAEAVWASALAASKGLKRPKPSILFGITILASLAGLAYAMTVIPTSTAYAVWVGIGATLTVIWAMITRQEPATATRVGLLALLVGCIIALKVVS